MPADRRIKRQACLVEHNSFREIDVVNVGDIKPLHPILSIVQVKNREAQKIFPLAVLFGVEY